MDAACRRAQREHDEARSSARDHEPVEPVYIAPRPKSLEQLAEDLRQALLAKAREVVAAAEDDNPYNVIDRFYEVEKLLEPWCEALDDVEESKGWPNLPEEIRTQLLASRG